MFYRRQFYNYQKRDALLSSFMSQKPQPQELEYVIHPRELYFFIINWVVIIQAHYSDN